MIDPRLADDPAALVEAQYAVVLDVLALQQYGVVGRLLDVLGQHASRYAALAEAYDGLASRFADALTPRVN